MKGVSIIVLFAWISPSLLQNPGCELPFEDIGGMCLLIDPLQEGSWYDMRLFCSRQAAGGNLVKINDANQLASIIEKIYEYGIDHKQYWTAASDEDHEGVWRYTDGSSVPQGSPFWRYDCNGTFSMRPLDDSDANCAALDRESHYRMADFSCLGLDAQLTFSPICQDPKETYSTTRTSTTDPTMTSTTTQTMTSTTTQTMTSTTTPTMTSTTTPTMTSTTTPTMTSTSTPAMTSTTTPSMTSTTTPSMTSTTTPAMTSTTTPTMTSTTTPTMTSTTTPTMTSTTTPTMTSTTTPTMT